MELDEVTDNSEDIGIAGVNIATSILEDLSSHISQEQNTTVSVQMLSHAQTTPFPWVTVWARD